MIKTYVDEVLTLVRSRTARSMSLLVSGNLAVSVLGFIGSIIVLRNLDAEAIGLLYPLIGIMMIVDQLADLGLSTSFVKIAASHLTVDPSRADRIANVVFKAKVALAVLVPAAGMAVAPMISSALFQTAAHVSWVRLIFAASALSVVATYYQAYLQVESRFGTLTASRLLPNLAKVLMLLALAAWDTFSFVAVFAAFMLIPIGGALLGAALSGTRYLARSAFSHDFPEVFHFTKWVLISSVSVALIGQVDVFMLRAMSGPEELARYVGGQRLASILPVFTSSLVTVLLPKVSAYRTRPELRHYFRRSLLLAPVIVMVTLLAVPFAPEIIAFVLGEKYEPSIPVFQVMCVLFAVSVFVGPMSLILYSLNKPHVFSAMNAVQLLLNIAGNLILIPRYGALGAAYSGLLIRVFGALVVLFVCHREGVAGAYEASGRPPQ